MKIDTHRLGAEKLPFAAAVAVAVVSRECEN